MVIFGALCPGVSLMARYQANSADVRTIFPNNSDLVDSFSHKEVQIKSFCPCVITSCPPTEIVNETPVCLPKQEKQKLLARQV